MKTIFKFDKIVYTLLFFILFLLTLFYYLYKIDKDIELHDYEHDDIVTLELLNKDLNNFSFTMNSFDDYDTINLQLLTFEKTLAHLKKRVLTYDPQSKRFQKDFLAIAKSFDAKKENINYFKSLNASLISGSHFLFDLQTTIEDDNTITLKDKLLVNEALFYLLRYTTSSYISKSYASKKLFEIKKIKHHYIKNFYKQSSVILNTTASLKEVATEIQTSSLDRLLNQLHKTADAIYDENLAIQKNIATTFFFLTILILLVMIKMHLEALKAKQKLLQAASVYNFSEEAIVIADTNGKVTSVNDAFSSIYGYSLEEIQGKTLSFLQSGNQDKNFYETMWHQLLSDGIWRGKFINKTKNAHHISVWNTIKQIKDENGKILNYISLQTDLREIEKSQAKVNYLAYHDALTGLYNRAHFEEYLEHSLLVAKRKRSLLAVMFIDLDRFKIINDTLGHDIGDAVLIHISKSIQETLRESDFISRWGGDEFVIILEDVTSISDVTLIATNLVEKLKEPMQINTHRLTITASIGISLYPQHGEDINSLIKHADSAMYHAKDMGKNNFRYYTDTLSEEIQERLTIDMALYNALKENELYMVFQPQYRLKDNSIQSLEALIRWNSKTLGIIGSDIFIPIAEENGTIIEIGYFVFEASCKALREMLAADVPLEYMAINVSSVQFRETHLLENFIAIAKKYDLEPKDIEIEITERLIMDLSKGEENPLQKFRDVGFQISIDDFGTGYSSMSYLQYLPIDTIKIDKSFVDDINQENPSNIIIEAIIALSKTLHYQIVSEGIEEKEQEDFLHQKRCDLGQGYLFSRPVTKEKIIKRFKN